MRRFIITIKQAFRQIWRNKAMTIASMFSITAILLILGLFFIMVVNINNIAESAKDDFDTIQIYLLDETSEVRINEMIAEFEGMEEVDNASFLSRDDAMDNWKEKWGDTAYLLDNLEENPLPNSIIVTVRNLEDADSFVIKAKQVDGIEDINYYKDTVDKLLQVTKFIQIGAIVIICALVFISIVVVSNTIKLTVLAREREINIMKYVGATNWFIRGPFLLEGMIIGILSALVSVAIIAPLYSILIERVGADIIVILSTSLIPVKHFVGNLVLIFLSLGISIGACGSIISIRRFLDT